MPARPGAVIPKIFLTGAEPGTKMPDLVVAAISETNQVIESAKVGADGSYELAAASIKKAHRIVVGPPTRDVAQLLEVGMRLRIVDYEATIRDNLLEVAPGLWRTWIRLTTCVSGRVRHCIRPRWWFTELTESAIRPIKPVRPGFFPITKIRTIPEIIALPFRCETVCNGVVEVYRRRCCCTPWIIADPRLPGLIRDLDDLIRIPELIPEFPPGIVGPRPGPDPSPIDTQVPSFIRDGAMDEMRLNAAQDRAALRRLDPAKQIEYISARAWLRCRGESCGAASLVGTGNIMPDGRFNICWREFPILLRAGCHWEYAYVVKQTVGGITRVIYNGVAANTWFNGADNATLNSYAPWAFSCRENGEPGTGAFVFLDRIGGAESHRLATPVSTGWDRVGSPVYNSGLLDPAPTPAAAVGQLLDRNWGGTLALTYMFSEDLRSAPVNARYYRVSVTDADATGAPVGTRHYHDAAVSWRYAQATATGVEIFSQTLGPLPPVGGEQFLYTIPYDADKDWLAQQAHAFIDTTKAIWNDPTKRHLITIEIFDGAGKRLRPTGTAPIAAGDPAAGTAFTFRRLVASTGPTLNVPHAALTHLFWWDNRALQMDLIAFTSNGAPSTQQCLFLEGSTTTQFGVQYYAYHPNPMFKLHHNISYIRGLGAGGGSLETNNPANVVAPTNSATQSLADMLGTFEDPPGSGTMVQRKRCAFAVTLRLDGKMTDGSSPNPWVSETGAVALTLA
jgi:hypothetical protein